MSDLAASGLKGDKLATAVLVARIPRSKELGQLGFIEESDFQNRCVAREFVCKIEV